MAVYTDVTAEELAGFLAGYDLGELLSYKGIAEGVENSNFLVHTSTGQLHPDPLREAGGGQGPAVLPRPDAAPGQPRDHLSAADQEQEGRRRSARSPAARPRSSPSSTACGSGGRAPVHCAALGEALAQAAPRRARFRRQAPQHALGRRLAAAVRALPRPRQRGAAQSPRPDREGAGRRSSATGRAACRRA